MSDNCIEYALYKLRPCLFRGYYRFYDSGEVNYYFLVLLDTGELVYANTIIDIRQDYTMPPKYRYVGTGFVHDILQYQGCTYPTVYPMVVCRDRLLNRDLCIIKHTREGEGKYGTLLSEEELKRAFNW